MQGAKPRALKHLLMSLVEGSTLFVGREGQWADDVTAVRDALLAFIKATLALYSDPIVGQSGRRAATPSTIAAK